MLWRNMTTALGPQPPLPARASSIKFFVQEETGLFSMFGQINLLCQRHRHWPHQPHQPAPESPTLCPAWASVLLQGLRAQVTQIWKLLDSKGIAPRGHGSAIRGAYMLVPSIFRARRGVCHVPRAEHRKSSFSSLSIGSQAKIRFVQQCF